MEAEPENLFKNLLDPVIFSESFIKLEGPNGMEEWKMDAYQKHLMRDINRNRVINKSKKTGISTTIAGESIHKAFTNKGRQVIFVSTGQRIAEELLGKWYDMLATLPSALQPEFDKKSMQVARLPNGARIMSLPSSDPGNIRGFGMRGPMTDVYVDEYAHIANDKELWIVVRDFQILGGHITLNSTPKGKRGKFYEVAEPLQVVFHGLGPKFDTPWSYHEIKYTDCPRLVKQEEFLKAGMTDMDFFQEYGCIFVDESLAFFPFDLIWDCQTVHEFVAPGYRTKNPIFFGIDFGKQVSETIVYVVEEIAPESFKTIYIEEMPGVNYDDQVEAITILSKEFKPTAINIDGTGPGGKHMTDALSKEHRCGNLINSYDLMSTFKENIIIRLRVLMQRKKFAIPSKNMGNIAEKFEMQLHSIQRTSTKTGVHTRYSGKESGYDDMVWAACYDNETEVLTEEGYKYFKDVTFSDKIMTLNPESHTIEYFNPTKLIVNNYEGNMIHFIGKGTDIKVTPNHNMYVRESLGANKYTDYKFVEAKKLLNKHFRIKKNAKWIGKNEEFYILPEVKEIRQHPARNYIRETKKIPMDLWLEFLGYFVSEGSIGKNRICIYQSLFYNADKVEKIRICLNKFKKYVFSIKEHIDKKGIHFDRPMMHWRIYDRQLYLHLLNFGTHAPNKFLSKEIKSLSSEHLKILFDALYLGDGATNGHIYYTSSEKLRDDVIELLLKIGYSANYSVDNGDKGITYNIIISKRSKEPRFNHHKNYGGKVVETPYSGFVYCVEVPNHIVYVRRNGKSCWCGNSLAVYKEFEYSFEPMIVVHQDPVLARLSKERERSEQSVYIE